MTKIVRYRDVCEEKEQDCVPCYDDSAGSVSEEVTSALDAEEEKGLAMQRAGWTASRPGADGRYTSPERA